MRACRRSVAAILLAVSLGACHSATAPASVAVVSVQVARATVAAGAPVATTVTVENRGDAPLRLVGGSTCMAHLEVRNSAGDRVGGDSRVCTMDLVECVLAPGATWTEQPVWDGRLAGGGAAPPGAYSVRGGVVMAGGSQALSAPVSVTVVTP